jgi:hypothetical protein
MHPHARILDGIEFNIVVSATVQQVVGVLVLKGRIIPALLARARDTDPVVFR